MKQDTFPSDSLCTGRTYKVSHMSPHKIHSEKPTGAELLKFNWTLREVLYFAFVFPY